MASAVNGAIYWRCVVTSLSQDICPKNVGLLNSVVLPEREGRNDEMKAASNKGLTPKIKRLL